jgi:glyoxylase-like metal-dependent hydrolase (beta-lactamase superfamily II)
MRQRATMKTPADSSALLPSDVVVLERGWLSSNSVVLVADDECVAIDSGYVTHSEQTIDLIDAVRGARPLTRLINTHLHSDHCGGNAAIQARHPSVDVAIPRPSWEAVSRWDEDQLSLRATGQSCARFTATSVLQPGDTVRVGDRTWSAESAPGHDPHSLMFFEPSKRILISADALWERGFGVIFPELDGLDAFEDAARTLDHIERLRPRLVIPGHGSVFADVDAALGIARRRLHDFRADPSRHATHAAKVLLKFKLLEWQRIDIEGMLTWAEQVPLLLTIHKNTRQVPTLRGWLLELLQALEASGAARLESGQIFDL